jgi:tRNA(Ile)-lysidine synthase
MLVRARGVVVAVSGGADSVALLDMLVRVGGLDPASKLRLHIAHLDHLLRGQQSAEDAEFVRELAARLGLSITVGAADVRREAQATGRGIEEAAREIRYNFLLGVARAADCQLIATGHTMNDQAETFLMRLARGAGLRGLAAMRPVAKAHAFERDEEGIDEKGIADSHPLLVRPLLAITREEVEEYCRTRSLEFREDASNLSEDYTRNRVRREVIPALSKINPRVVERIARASEIIADDEDALSALACSLLDEARKADSSPTRQAYPVRSLADRPAGLRRRMIIEAIARSRRPEAGGPERAETGSIHVDGVLKLVEEGRSGSRVDLPGGLKVWREFDEIVFEASSGAAAYEVELSLARPGVEAGGLLIRLLRGLRGDLLESTLDEARSERARSGQDWFIAALDDTTLPERLIIRPRRAGERAHVVGQRQTKKLKKLMIDHKIPPSRRRAWPVVTTQDDRYVWSPGLPPSVEFAARDETSGLAILRASAV